LTDRVTILAARAIDEEVAGRRRGIGRRREAASIADDGGNVLGIELRYG
jgi:hypothetical protein